MVHIYNTDNISHEDLLFLDQLHHSWGFYHEFYLKMNIIVCIINQYRWKLFLYYSYQQ